MIFNLFGYQQQFLYGHINLLNKIAADCRTNINCRDEFTTEN